MDSGVFFGFGAGANMLAQLFLTPSGIMLETAAAGVVPHASSPVLISSRGLSSMGVSQAGDSVVGTDHRSSLACPFVAAVAVVAPRPLGFPLPRSVARPRPPLAASRPPRPPREGLLALESSTRGVLALSWGFDLDRSFFEFETSPHWEMVPVQQSQPSCTPLNSIRRERSVCTFSYTLYSQLQVVVRLL